MKIKKISAKALKVFMAILVTVVTIGIPPYFKVNADNNTKLVIKADGNIITNDDNDDKLEYHIGNILVGKVTVAVAGSDTNIIPTGVPEGFSFDFGDANAKSIIVTIEPEEGYTVSPNYDFGDNRGNITNNQIELDLTAGILSDLSFKIEQLAGGNAQSGAMVNASKPEGSIVEINSNDSTKINYSNGSLLMGTLKLGNGNEYFTPIIEPNGNVKFDLPDPDGTPYKVYAELDTDNDYSVDIFYHLDGDQFNTPSDNVIEITISDNSPINLNFNFVEMMGPPIMQYPIVAYFEGIGEGVGNNSSNDIVIPSNWTQGKITFKTRICESNSMVVPNDGFQQCDVGTEREIPVEVEGIANGSEINDTVNGNRQFVNILPGFNDYGKLLLHIVSAEPNGQVNQLVKIVSEKLISIKAIAPYEMSQSFGTVAVNQAIITNDTLKNVNIFFGNTETTLIVEGTNVKGITAVEGNLKKIIIDEDGTATLTLPDLNMATTIAVEVKIKLKDDTEITRKINIVRTAITLQHNNGGGDNSVYAGYVVNKGYLYNNRAHDDNEFNAYLQVMLYKDDVVVGYKQIKIDDEDLVNFLQNNESGSLELYSEKQIAIYGLASNDLTDGVNKVSVFLTDGPIDFNGDKLPSVEFGIGAGVELEWEAE